MQLQFLAPVELFFDQLKGYSLWAESIFFYLCSFPRCVVCHVYTLIKNGTFNHCGRSNAWNSTHHGRYVFQTAFFREKYEHRHVHIHIHIHNYVHIHS